MTPFTADMSRMDLKHWKATELKNWLLHYSVAVLRETLNPLYFFHWTLLVGGMGILCSDSISNDDLGIVDQMLQDFVLLMEVLYGPTKCTMNVHLLQHLRLLCFTKRTNLGI